MTKSYNVINTKIYTVYFLGVLNLRRERDKPYLAPSYFFFAFLSCHRSRKLTAIGKFNMFDQGLSG